MDPNLKALVLLETLRTPSKITGALLNPSHDSASVLVETLPRDVQDILRTRADDLHQRGVRAVTADEELFPRSLLASGRPVTPILFCRGNLELLSTPSVGFSGSRNASELGLKAARACATEVTSRSLAIVAGNAKGIDTVSAVTALETGGSAIIVLPEGIDRYRARAQVRDSLADERTLVVSQFNPQQPWAAHTAMTRNHVVSGLSRALVVIEAGERGGTLSAGLDALKRGRPVFALDLADDTPPGNIRLWEAGARRASSRTDLGEQLARIDEPPEQQSLL